ncbi:MAG: lysophospholipid acyltransferase family protein [Candidatus Competibacterales bacterium]
MNSSSDVSPSPAPTSPWQTLRRGVGAGLFSAGMLLSAALVSSLEILCFWAPFTIRYRITKLWTGFCMGWLKLTCGLNYQIQGREYLPREAMVIMAKHQSTWETLFFNYQLPPLAWVLKRELLWVPFFGWGMALLEPISIDRRAKRGAMRQVLEQGKAHLERGRCVLIFPEGTRMPPGTRRRYGASGARLAVKSGRPILPIAHNAGDYWPRKTFIKHPGTIQVVIGPPIPTADRTPDAVLAETEAWIEGAMERISLTQPIRRLDEGRNTATD